MLASGVRAERIREVASVDPRALPDEVLASTEPLVLRGLATHWPVVSNKSNSTFTPKRWRLVVFAITPCT